MTTVVEQPTIPKQRERVENRDFRRQMASSILGYFAQDTVIIERDGSLVVSWTIRGEPVFKRWQCRRGQDFYPVWSHKWAHGGTACTALSQLIRWVQGRPVLPLSTWRYWMGDRCQLARGDGDRVIELLIHGGYPEHAHCVLCGRQLNGLDWWNLGNVSGPCCAWTSGCRQKQ